jgi:hypothetical protein
MTSDTEKHRCDLQQDPGDAPILQGLIPIAVVITAGCEPCAERMVNRALQEGSSRRQILKAIAIVEGVHGSECFRTAVGQEVCDRMVKPLARARRAAEDGSAEAAQPAGRSCC